MTIKPVSSKTPMIPESRIAEAGNLWEENDISFSEGFCTSCVGFIDMVNSTKITASLKRDQMSKYYSLFINWAAAVIKGYGGTVVKNIGDGLLFYFPYGEESENINTIRDCLNCSIVLSRLHPNVNMKFRLEMLPELNYRISLDYGEVSLARTFDAGLDIFSSTVNICAKINSIAAPNTVVVGGDMYQVSRNLNGYDFQQAKTALSIADRPYPVYSVSEAKTILHCFTSKKSSPAHTSEQVALRKTEEVKTV